VFTRCWVTVTVRRVSPPPRVAAQVFIACPGHSFAHRFSDLGGVRVITHFQKAKKGQPLSPSSINS
jgi:hypothetical protein